MEFRNLDISGIGGGYGIYSGGDVLIEDCIIHHVTFMGIHVYDAEDIPANYIVRNNIIRDITHSYFFGKPDPRLYGMIVNGTNGQIYNNIIYGLSLAGGLTNNVGILAYRDSGQKIWHNTIVNNPGTGGIRVDMAASVEIRNNLVFGNGYAAYVTTGSNTVESNNMFNVQPDFVNPSGRDFQLTPTSPAVDAGGSLSAVTTDLAGVARPQGSRPDIGAYEYRGQAAAAPGPPAPPTGVRIVSN